MDKNVVKMWQWKEFFEKMSKIYFCVYNFPNKTFP
jgi:hypothetical protein